MIPLLKYCIKVLLLYTILVFLVFVIADFSGNKESNIPKSLSGGLLTGIIFTAFQMWILLHRLKKLGIHEFTNDTFKMHQIRVINSDISNTDLIKKIRSDNFTCKMQFEVKNNTIKLNSMGEIIQISMSEQEESPKQIVISSKPSWFLDLWNNGKNLENVIYLEKMINSITN
jgi:hypothetical protein